MRYTHNKTGLWWRFLAWKQQLINAICSPTASDPAGAAAAAAAAAAQGGTVLLTKQLPRGAGVSRGGGSSSSGSSSGSGSSGGQAVFVPAEEVDPEETPAEALFKRLWRFGEVLLSGPVAAVKSAGKVINPPVAATIAGEVSWCE
jgi:hypothetical protein